MALVVLFVSQGLYTPIIYSDPFRVGVGAPAQLTFQAANPLSVLPIHGGEFFLVPPRINILDAGVLLNNK